LAAIASLGGFSGGEGLSLKPAWRQRRRRDIIAPASDRLAHSMIVATKVYQAGASNREATV